MVLYVGHLCKSGLGGQISELQGMKLLWDCRAEVPCVADILIAECLSDVVQPGKVKCQAAVSSYPAAAEEGARTVTALPKDETRKTRKLS